MAQGATTGQSAGLDMDIMGMLAAAGNSGGAAGASTAPVRNAYFGSTPRVTPRPQGFSGTGRPVQNGRFLNRQKATPTPPPRGNARAADYYDSNPRGHVSTEDELRDADDASLDFRRWTDDERAEWGEYLVTLGVIDADDVGDWGTLEEAWAGAVEDSATFLSAGKKVTPRDAVRMMSVAAGAKVGRRSGSKSEAQYGTMTSSSSQVDITDPVSARALVNSVLSRQLGRNARPEEVEQFTATLNSAERANPLVTTDTTTTSAAGESTSTTRTGGLGDGAREQLLTDKAQQDDEYGAFQASSTYLDALYRALQAPV